VSSSNLWDFDVESFVTTAESSKRQLSAENSEFVVTEVDKYVNWIGVGIAQPLIKMAIFVSDEGIELLDEQASIEINTLLIEFQLF
jgi:hypothetical protein